MAFSAGGDGGGRRSPEHQAQSAHVVCGTQRCRTIAIYEYTSARLIFSEREILMPLRGFLVIQIFARVLRDQGGGASPSGPGGSPSPYSPCPRSFSRVHGKHATQRETLEPRMPFGKVPIKHGRSPPSQQLITACPAGMDGIVIRWEPDGLRLSSDRTCFCRPFSDGGGRRPLAHVQP